MKPRKPALKRAKDTGELELPWAGYRRQRELQAAAMTPEELLESQRLARLLVAGELPGEWWPAVEVEVQGKLFEPY